MTDKAVTMTIGISGILNFGNGSPIAELGNLGDGYFDASASKLYGPKSVGGWGEGFALAGGSNYVPLPLGVAEVVVNLPSPTGHDQLDYSAFASNFLHTPKAFQCMLTAAVHSAANTDGSHVTFWDGNPDDSVNPESFFQSFPITTVGAHDFSNNGALCASFWVTPNDFNATTTYNIWLDSEIGSGLTWISPGVSLYIVGYIY